MASISDCCSKSLVNWNILPCQEMGGIFLVTTIQGVLCFSFSDASAQKQIVNRAAGHTLPILSALLN
jgi:hypothetical protein